MNQEPKNPAKDSPAAPISGEHADRATTVPVSCEDTTRGTQVPISCEHTDRDTTVPVSCEYTDRGTTVPISCEFFPTTTDEGARKLDEVRRQLAAALPWQYFSVTYGAGGSTRERTINTVQRVLKDGFRAMPHLTCVAHSRQEIENLLNEYRAFGINQLMALRGDMPSGMYQSGDLQPAKELVAFTRQRWGEQAKIFVAAYPEFHPAARSPSEDLDFFCAKVRAGADEAITQYFFNGDSYLRFRDEVAKRGIHIPIAPGIMAITNYSQLSRFSDSCGAEIPRWIRKRLESLQNDQEGLLEFGADVVADLCARLIREGAPALHFYSMNRADSILAIAQRLGWLNG